METESWTNVLLTTFSGSNLPRTLCLPVPLTEPLSSFSNRLTSILPGSLLQNGACHNIHLIGSSGLQVRLPTASTESVLALAAPSGSRKGDALDVLPLALYVPTLGGKGGFGSQLRAAGGRMSSRKKKQQNGVGGASADPNASSRNLEGRRLRTVGEAKALAEYLAVKPGMDKKQKEEQRKRWEAVVDASERRIEEIREGKAPGGRAVGNSQWLEDKEEAEEKMRQSVKLAMQNGLLNNTYSLNTNSDSKGKGRAIEANSSEESMEGSGGDNSDESVTVLDTSAHQVGNTTGADHIDPKAMKTAPPRRLFFPDFDEDFDDEESDEDA